MTASERLRVRDIRTISSFRLTLGLGLLFLIGVAALLGVIYLATATTLTARSDEILWRGADRFAATPPEALPGEVAAAVKYSTSRLNYFAVRDSHGRLVAGNFNPASFHGRVPYDRPFDVAPAPGAPRSLRMLVVRTHYGETLMIARDISQLIELTQQLLVILLISGVLIVALVGIGGILIGFAPLKRVRALQQAAREIAAGDLDQRMPIQGRGDEIDMLAGTVNVMVDEVARMIDRTREVTEVVAHDLRSPLARVRNRLGAMRQARDPAAADHETFAIVLADLDLVLDRFAALLRTAEIEASRRRAGFQTVYLRPLLEAVADLYTPLAEERGVGLDIAIDSDPSLHGDDKLLFEAVSNLVDNAIKFVGESGLVTLAVQARPHEVVIEVRDDGPGIPPDERELVLRRFHRGRNATGIGGSGIGLSAVMAIVHIHGCTLELADAAPGLIARIRCPV